jgi:hypothetical protein
MDTFEALAIRPRGDGPKPCSRALDQCEHVRSRSYRKEFLSRNAHLDGRCVRLNSQFPSRRRSCFDAQRAAIQAGPFTFSLSFSCSSRVSAGASRDATTWPFCTSSTLWNGTKPRASTRTSTVPPAALRPGFDLGQPNLVRGGRRLHRDGEPRCRAGRIGRENPKTEILET